MARWNRWQRNDWRDRWGRRDDDDEDPIPEPTPEPDPIPEPEPDPVPDPGFVPTPGLNEIIIMHNGVARSVLIDVPDNFDPTQEYSAVFVFHGLNASAQGMVQTGMADHGEEMQYLTIYPSAIDGRWDLGYNGVQKDDIGFVTSIISELEDNWSVNADQVFATGHSQGGYFTQYLAANAPDLFAGYGVVAVGLPDNMAGNYTPGEDQPFIFFHSTGDPNYPFEGFREDDGAYDTVDFWAAENDTQMGASWIVPDSDGYQTSASFSDDGTIAHYVTEDASHAWAPDYGDAIWPETTTDLDVSALMVEFFEDYGL